MREETRITVTADQVRWLARKRRSLALATFPIFLLVGGGALFVSLNLALVAVLGGFLAYACISIALRQSEVARDAVDLDVTVRGNELHLPGQAAPRPIFRAIDRADYLRLISTEDRVVGLWLDDRRDPTASFDLAASRQSRQALCACLRAAGIHVATEGSTQRVLVLAGALALGVLALTAERVLLGLTATAMLLSPMSWVLLGALAVVVGLSRRRRASDE